MSLLLLWGKFINTYRPRNLNLLFCLSRSSKCWDTDQVVPTDNRSASCEDKPLLAFYLCKSLYLLCFYLSTYFIYDMLVYIYRLSTDLFTDRYYHTYIYNDFKSELWLTETHYNTHLCF